MKYRLHLSPEAEQDIASIVWYIAEHDVPRKARYVAEEIEKRIASLDTFPDIGSYPPELLQYGRRNIREIHWKPYRIFYRIEENDVHVLAVADGRRDLEQFLINRILD